MREKQTVIILKPKQNTHRGEGEYAWIIYFISTNWRALFFRRLWDKTLKRNMHLVKSKCWGHSTVLASLQVRGSECTGIPGCWQQEKRHRLLLFLYCVGRLSWCWMIHFCCTDRQWTRRKKGDCVCMCMCVVVCVCTHTHHKAKVIKPIPPPHIDFILKCYIFYIFILYICLQTLIKVIWFLLCCYPKDKQKLQQFPSPTPTKWVTIFGLVPFKLSCKVIAQKEEFSLWDCR